MASPGGKTTTLGSGTAILGGGTLNRGGETLNRGGGTPFRPVPPEFNHWWRVHFRNKSLSKFRFAISIMF